jgi:hypothetical protein
MAIPFTEVACQEIQGDEVQKPARARAAIRAVREALGLRA